MSSDYDLEQAVQRWLRRVSVGEAPEQAMAPGLTNLELRELETACGFALHESVRTVYSTTAEIVGSFPVAGVSLSPARLCGIEANSVEDSLRHSYWTELTRFVTSEEIELSRAHVPENMCLTMVGGGDGYFVDCGDLNDGAVFMCGIGGVGWISPSLERVFERADELYDRELLDDSFGSGLLMASVPRLERLLQDEYGVSDLTALHYWAGQIASLRCDVDDAMPVVSDSVFAWRESYQRQHN